MVSTINEATRKNLRDFFEQELRDFLLFDNQITREEFIMRFEYFMMKKEDDQIHISTDEQIEIFLFLKEALKDYINVNATGPEIGERYKRYKRYISFSFSAEPCDIQEWEAMMNCIYDKKENACPF